MATSAVIGALRVNLGIDTAAFQNGLRDVQKSLGRVGKRLQRVGRDLSIKVSAPIAAIGGLSLKAFSDFEKGLIGVGKTTDITGQQLQDLGRAIQDVGTSVPVATTELLAIAQAAGQLGVQGNENITRFTETVAKLGISSNLAGDQAATALARILTITGTSIGDVDRLGSTIVRLGNNFAATEAEIAGAATRVAQATSQFGVAASEVAGIGAALAAVGVEAEAGGTVIGRAFQSINDAVRQGGKEMEAFVQITGRSAEELRTLFTEDPTQAFKALVDGLGRISAEGGDVTSALSSMGLEGVRVIQVLGTLATRSGVLTDALAQSKAEWQENAALNREAAAATESFAAQTQLARNALNQAATALGSAIAPAARDLINILAEIARSLSQLNPTVLRFGVVVGGIAAVIGPVVLGLGLLAAAIAAVGVPVAAVIAGIGLLAAAIITFWDDIEPVVTAIADGFKLLWEGIKNDIETIKQAFNDFAAFIDQPLSDIVDQSRGFLVDQMGDIWERMKADLRAIRGFFVSIFGEELVSRFEQFHINLFNIATEMITKIKDVFVGGFTFIKDTITGALESITSLWRSHEDEVVGNSIVPDMVDAIIGEFDRMGVGIRGATQQATNGVVNDFSVMSSGIGNEITGPLKNAFKQGELEFDNFREAALSIATRLRDQLIEQAFKPIEDALSKLFGGGSSGGGGGGIFGALGSAIVGIFGGGGGLTTTGTGSFGAGNAPFGTLGFANGGEFTVGGASGIDRNLVAFRASRGERVTIDPPGGRRGKLGVESSGGNTFNIDARGADQAAIARLESMIITLSDQNRIRRIAVDGVADARQRGHSVLRGR